MKLLRIILLASPMWLAACSSTPTTADYMDADGYSASIAPGGSQHNPDIIKVIRQEQFKNVLLVRREAGSDANSHPSQISAATLSAALRQLRFTRGKDKPEDLFDKDNPAEVKELAAMLAEGLALAGPDQELVFHYPLARGVSIFTENFMLNGRVFVRDQRLHIIFGEIRTTYEGMWLRARVLRKFKVPTRQANQLEERAIVSLPLVAFGPGDRRDWAVIDLRQLEGTTAADAPHEASAPAATSAAGAAPVAVSERLRQLQQLKDKGLISDDEYQSKRRQILDAL